MITIGDLAAHYIAVPTNGQMEKFDTIFQQIKQSMDANSREMEMLEKVKIAIISKLGS